MPNVLITGAAKRLGAEFAKRFAKDGAHVVVHYNSSATDAEALQKTIREDGGTCEIVQGGLTSRADVEQIFAKARAAVGPISVLINNASTFVNDDIENITEEHFDLNMMVNLKAPLIFADLFAQQPEAFEDRFILNMLDNKMYAMNPDFFSYTLSKMGLALATEMLAMRYDGQPRVCGIAPSITLISGKQTQENFEKSSRVNPLERRVFPKDICDTAMFLWKNRSMNNQVITVDGGQNLFSLPRDVAFYIKEGVEFE